MFGPNMNGDIFPMWEIQKEINKSFVDEINRISDVLYADHLNKIKLSKRMSKKIYICA